MEHVLDVYSRPYDPKEPVVAMDETTKQLTAEVLEPLPPQPGQPARFDTLYRRNGVAVLFMFFEPLSGWREVNIADSKTRLDWAFQIQRLLDDHYPRAKKVHLVLDNLNTHGGASLYEAFAPEEAHRLLSRLEFHYTPKHGSWLNVAEIELSVLSRQCLTRRIGDGKMLCDETHAWYVERNQRKGKVDWQFKTSDARIKLKKLYPTL
jgi:transposase